MQLDIPTCTRVDEGVGTIAYTTTNYDTSTARAVTPMVYERYGAPHATNTPNAATHAGRVQIGRQTNIITATILSGVRGPSLHHVCNYCM